ncbi:MAG TPA: ice-binding family protein [Candidatus Limnocylindrales bacterium]
MKLFRATRPRRTATGVAITLAGVILLGAGPPTVSTGTLRAVDLGEAASFAVLAGGGVRDTGPSAITGDVGTHPLPTIPDLLDAETSGIVDRAGTKSRLAQMDVANALATLAQLPPGRPVSLVDDRTLAAGVYAVTESQPTIAGTLTLDGQDTPDAVWVFVVASDLQTAPGSAITLVNGARACNVFWRVGGSASLGAGSTFAGSVIAATSVTAGANVTVDGRLIAMTAAVTLGGDRIRVPTCATRAASPAPQATSAGVVTVSSRRVAPSSATRIALPPYLPLVMLVMVLAAAILAEPRHEHRHPSRARW